MKQRSFGIFLLGLLLIALYICGCESMGYTGSDYAANTLIQYECPHDSSYSSASERVETDEYGRVLFKYWGGHGLYFDGSPDIYAIIQKEDSKNIWHYGSDSYVLIPPGEALIEEKLDTLKEKNDWGKEPDLEKAEKVPIIKGPLKGTYSRTHIENMITPMCREGEDFKYFTMAVDKNGQVLVLFRIFTWKGDKPTDITSYAAIIQPDGTYSTESIEQIEDFYSPNETIKKLKEIHGWVSQGS